MPDVTHDADDTQPERNKPNRDHRIYIPATWAAPGTGGGAPKLSGGVTIDHKTGAPAPRALNRPDQRYNQPLSTIIANRQARAASEYATSVTLLGAEGRYEVRSPSGNSYDVGSAVLDCDCPDWFRLDESGYGIIRCKHIYIVMTALSDPGLPQGIPWSCAKLAEECTCAERTAQHLCQIGDCIATLTHNVWVIQPDDGEAAAAVYRSRLIG